MSTHPMIQINEVSIEQLTYKDVPVVTFQQIAEVHGIAVKTVHDAFRRHRRRFTEGKHCFRLDFTEASQLLARQEVSANGLLLFTEKGYLLLTKPMRDEKSWQVQERMIDDYFALKTAAPVPPQIESPAMRLRNLETGIDMLERLGQFTPRDKLVFADAIRNALVHQGGQTTPTRQGFSIAERVAQLGYHLSAAEQRTHYAPLGVRVANQYRTRYQRQPESESRYVDGAVRAVKWYADHDAVWIDALLQIYLARHGFHLSLNQPSRREITE